MKKLIIIIILLASAQCYSYDRECLDRNAMMCTTYRIKIFNGWLVIKEGYHEQSMVYIRDEKHEWKI